MDLDILVDETALGVAALTGFRQTTALLVVAGAALTEDDRLRFLSEASGTAQVALTQLCQLVHQVAERLGVPEPLTDHNETLDEDLEEVEPRADGSGPLCSCPMHCRPGRPRQ